MTSIDFKKLLNCKQSSVANPARVGGFSGMDAPSKTLRFYYIHALKKCSFKQPPHPPTLPEENLSLWQTNLTPRKNSRTWLCPSLFPFLLTCTWWRGRTVLSIWIWFIQSLIISELCFFRSFICWCWSTWQNAKSPILQGTFMAPIFIKQKCRTLKPETIPHNFYIW